MPPTRRRRPVQPATRVRLPRATRSQPAPPNGTVDTEPAEAIEVESGTEEGTDEATAPLADTAAADPAVADPAVGEAAVGEAAVGEAGEADAVDEAWDDDDDEPWDAEVESPAAAPKSASAKPASAKPASAGREPLLLPVCLGVATVVLGGLAVWFGLNTGSGSGTSGGFGTGGTNVALTNTAATNQVNSQIDTAVDTIFSYNYTDTAKTLNAAKAVLTGRASGEYATLFKVVQQDAPAEKLVLTTTVTNSGVEMLNGNTARLLIFANQKDTGATKGSTTDAGAMFAVTAVNEGGHWKIENIDTFSANG